MQLKSRKYLNILVLSKYFYTGTDNPTHINSVTSQKDAVATNNRVFETMQKGNHNMRIKAT